MNDCVIIISRPGLGTTCPEDSAFGMEMLDKFFHTLERQPIKPKAVCFYTEGVKAAVMGSPIEPSLQLLKGLGVQLIVCESCLKYYGLEKDAVVGTVGGMVDIVRLMSGAEKVITV